MILPEVFVTPKLSVKAFAVKSFANFCTAPSVSLRAKTAAAYSSSLAVSPIFNTDARVAL